MVDVHIQYLGIFCRLLYATLMKTYIFKLDLDMVNIFMYTEITFLDESIQE